MKRFFQSVSVLLLLLLWPVLSAEACVSEAPTHNAYLFSVYGNALMENSPFTSRLNDYWRKYVGSNNEYFDCISDSTAIMRAARKKGDRETYAYLRLLYRYVAASNMINSGWDYPTKQQLSLYSRLLNVMLSTSRNYKGQRLRTQYALMEMRALFAQKNYKAAADVWVKKGKAQPAGVFRDLMQNLYAGCLLRMNQRRQAVEIYAQQQVFASLKYCVR